MSTQVGIPQLVTINISQILADRVDFSHSGNNDIAYSCIPRNYHVLQPDHARHADFDSPSTSNADRLTVSTGSQGSTYDSSTDSSSPISYTKELAAIASPLTPLTPLSDASRSKSKSPTALISNIAAGPSIDQRLSAGKDFDECPFSPTTPSPTNENKIEANSDKPNGDINRIANGIVPLTSTSSAKKKKKKKHKIENGSVKDCVSSSASTASISSNDDISSKEEYSKPELIQNEKGDAPSAPKIQFKLKESSVAKPSAEMASVFAPTPVKPRPVPALSPAISTPPKSITIKLSLGGTPVGQRTLVKPCNLVNYDLSDDEDSNDSVESKTQTPTVPSNLERRQSTEKEKPSPQTARRMIGPLLPSTEPIKTQPLPEKPQPLPAAKRKIVKENDEVPSTSKRKRLLSERGEKEMAYPVMDKATISAWNFRDFDLTKCKSRGPGLHNSANDCFLNAILQCITHTAPLCRYLWERHPHEKCYRPPGQCLSCGMRQNHLKRILQGNSGPFAASWIRPYLRKIFPSHIHGQQEDAHELLALMLDAFDPPPGHDKHHGIPNGLTSKPSTPIEQIFGGTLRNQVTCKGCQTPYINYERIRELNLAIRKSGMDGSPTKIPFLIENYFRDENLSSFDCKKCGHKTNAIRCTRILRPPAVLLVQLKRFNAFGQKIRLPVTADMNVDLTRFLFDSSASPSSSQYVLTGVVEHLGAGVDHGHYIAYSRGFQHDKWFHFDDELVQVTTPNDVINSNPYLLIYSRRTDLGMAAKNGNPVKSPAESPNSFHRPNGFVKSPHINGFRNSNGNSQFNKYNNGNPNKKFFNGYRPSMIG